MKEIYPLLASAMNQELRLSQIANNLANINTPGFKRDDSVFENVLNAEMGLDPATQALLEQANPADTGWPTLVNAFTDFTPGGLRSTENPLDMALDGPGFFTVRGDLGETFYTRAGNFKVNERNELITVSGRAVLDNNQNPITIDLSRGKPAVLPDGTIMQGNANVGRLGVVEFPDPQVLIKHGEGALFKAPAGLTPQPAARPAVQQAMLEGANVSAIDEMVHMIQTERAYQMQQKIIQTIDEIVARRLQVAGG